jgi:organic hydroperoxide reductase OsmC/OhrA
VSAKRFEHSVALDREGRARTEAGVELAMPEAWTAEHLVLAGLIRCTLASLDFFAKQQNIQVSGSGSGEGVVTRRDEDGRYAFVEIECGLDVELEPAPEHEALKELLERAEWGCFIGASLTVKPRYEWRVNGEVVA